VRFAVIRKRHFRRLPLVRIAREMMENMHFERWLGLTRSAP